MGNTQPTGHPECPHSAAKPFFCIDDNTIICQQCKDTDHKLHLVTDKPAASDAQTLVKGFEDFSLNASINPKDKILENIDETFNYFQTHLADGLVKLRTEVKGKLEAALSKAQSQDETNKMILETQNKLQELKVFGRNVDFFGALRDLFATVLPTTGAPSEESKREGPFITHEDLVNKLKSAPEYEPLLKDLEAITSVEKHGNGALKRDDLLKLITLVETHAKRLTDQSKAEHLSARRGFLKLGNEDAYKRCVMDAVIQDEALSQKLTTLVFGYFKVSERDFMLSQQAYAYDPEFKQQILDIQMKVDSKIEIPESLTREKTKEMLMFVEERKSQAIEELSSRMSSGQLGGDPQMDMIVSLAKIADQIHEKFGYEDEEFKQAVIKYKIFDDPDIQKMFQEQVAKYGMGGMPPSDMMF